MADEPKVVEGGEVTFEGGTSLPDSLSAPPEPAPPPPEVTSPLDPDVHLALTQYLSNIIEAEKRERQLSSQLSLWPHLAPLAPYLRFNSRMSVDAAPVPRQTAFSLIRNEHQTLAQLLSSTDLGEELPDPCDMSAPLPETVEAFGYSRQLAITRELQDLINVTKEKIIIPWRYFISLLIADGDTYRAFLKHSGENNNVSWYINGDKSDPNMAAFNPLILPPALEAFVRETGDSQVAGFVNDLHYLYGTLRDCKSSDRQGEIITTIYSRLKRYHPELTL